MTTLPKYPERVRYFRHPEWEVGAAEARYLHPGWQLRWPAEGHQNYDTVKDYPTLKAMREDGWRERFDVYACCGEIGGCGGPCAAFPCWELTT